MIKKIVRRFSYLRSILKMSLLYLIVVVFVPLIAVQKTGRIFPRNPQGIAFQDLIVKVTGVKAPLTSCTITYNFDSYQNYVLLDSKHPQDVNVSYIDNWKEGECGVHFKPLTKERTGSWDFKVKNGDGIAETYTAGVGIFYEGEPSRAKSKQVVLNKYVEVECSSSAARYAKLYDPKGKLVKEGSKATFEIERAKYEDNGIWKCVVLLENSPNERSYDINITVIKPKATKEIVISEKSETDSHINLVWKLYYEPKDCVFERPDGKLMSPKEGVLLANYAYFGNGTDLKECGISIAKPLTSEDIGYWRMIAYPPQRYSSSQLEYEQECGFLAVTNTSHSEHMNKLTIPVKTLTKDIRLLKSKDYSAIGCSARASLKYCYLRSPSGKINSYSSFSQHDRYSQSRNTALKFGECSLGLGPHIDPTETGSWICGMGVEGLAQDLQVSVNVLISAREMVTNSSQISAQMGSPVNVIFTSLKGYPLLSCRFNRPDGHGINVDALRNTTDLNYSYAGEGLENGDCGLLIKSLKNEDLGNWKVSVFHGKPTNYQNQPEVEDEYEITISGNNKEINL